MEIFPNGPGSSPRILLLGGTSEIGLAILSALAAPAQTQVILAGRDEQRLAAAGKQLPYQVRTHAYDATETDGHQAFADAIFAEGPLDMVISAAGILVPQPEVERDVRRAAEMVETNFTGHVTSLLAIAGQMRARGRGTIVVLSSVAAVRPRKANFVYGSAKAGLDSFARGLADSLHGTGVRVVLVRPGLRHRPDDGGHEPGAAGHHAGAGGRGHRGRAAGRQVVRLDPGPARRPGPGPAPRSRAPPGAGFRADSRR